MAKKTRRARLSQAQRYMPAPGAAAPEEASAPAARPAPSTRAAQTVVKLGQNPEEYAYIRTDLMRIGIFAGSILTALVVLRLLVFR